VAFQEECRTLLEEQFADGTLPQGEVAITTGGTSQYRWIFNAATMDFKKSNKTTYATVCSCMLNSLKTAERVIEEEGLDNFTSASDQTEVSTSIFIVSYAVLCSRKKGHTQCCQTVKQFPAVCGAGYIFTQGDSYSVLLGLVMANSYRFLDKRIEPVRWIRNKHTVTRVHSTRYVRYDGVL
jgi:hypothetical protein